MPQVNTYRAGPDERGHFGLYGGRFVAETLMPLILEVERAYEASKDDPTFAAELGYYHEHYVGRPTYSRQRSRKRCWNALSPR